MSDVDEYEEPPLPWYRYPSGPHPFSLIRKVTSNRQNSFRTLALFPWNSGSLATLWKGRIASQDETAWKKLISDFSDAIIVGGDRRVYIFYLKASKQPTCINLPDPPADFKSVSSDTLNVAWGLRRENHLEPLVLFSYLSLLYVYDIKNKAIVSCLRGHGGPITSIAVNPHSPHIFCTTSRDFSTRIYSLDMPPKQAPNNPPWPPSEFPSRAGPAHGLDMTEREGDGKYGRCVLVLMGGRSGGHQADVLGAAFHPDLPLIATCGMDRTVKIWFTLFSADPDILEREDKPLFSSSMIHKARVLSVTWLGLDLLLTDSAPAMMREGTGENTAVTYLEPGTLVLWRWLGVDRFFPAAQEELIRREGLERQQVLRGCASDYQESASFKFISCHSFPEQDEQYLTQRLFVFQSEGHDPLALFTRPQSDVITMLNLSHLEPRKPPTFPPDIVEKEVDEITAQTKRTRLSEGPDEPTSVVRRPVDGPQKISGWELKLSEYPRVPDRPDTAGETLACCAMGDGGSFIVGLGSRGSIWLWAAKN